jgi:hypothetical protein
MKINFRYDDEGKERLIKNALGQEQAKAGEVLIAMLSAGDGSKNYVKLIALSDKVAAGEFDLDAGDEKLLREFIEGFNSQMLPFGSSAIAKARLTFLLDDAAAIDRAKQAKAKK